MATINEITEITGAAFATPQRSPTNPTGQSPAAAPNADPLEAKRSNLQDTIEVNRTESGEAGVETGRLESGFSTNESAQAGTQANSDRTPPTSQPDQPSGPSSDAVQPGSGTPDDPLVTNQRTSSETERTGNDGSRSSEATRTLGQVVDIFA